MICLAEMIVRTDGGQSEFAHVFIEAESPQAARKIAAEKYQDILDFDHAPHVTLSVREVACIPNNDTAPFIKAEPSAYDTCRVDGEPYGTCAHPIGYEPLSRSTRSVIEQEARAAWSRVALNAAKKGQVMDADAVLSAILDGIDHRLDRPRRLNWEVQPPRLHAPLSRKQNPTDPELPEILREY